ncbi:MAG: 6-carboxytetrahydropterin synthase [Deltaproteobacteria bacterium]|nr:6-carboxytetrahydropterin synthase [Deltaproteobacteria bacterium]
MFRSSKRFIGFPCAHRRYAHEGRCAWVHGYSRSFEVWFECAERTPLTGFVMDFGGLKTIQRWLEERFDHTLLLDAMDPLLPEFRALEARGACKLTVLPDVGMEGTAKYVFDEVDVMVRALTGGRVFVYSVECRENEKNSAMYVREGREGGI